MCYCIIMSTELFCETQVADVVFFLRDEQYARPDDVKGNLKYSLNKHLINTSAIHIQYFDGQVFPF